MKIQEYLKKKGFIVDLFWQKNLEFGQKKILGTELMNLFLVQFNAASNWLLSELNYDEPVLFLFVF